MIWPCFPLPSRGPRNHRSRGMRSMITTVDSNYERLWFLPGINRGARAKSTASPFHTQNRCRHGAGDSRQRSAFRDEPKSTLQTAGPISRHLPQSAMEPPLNSADSVRVYPSQGYRIRFIQGENRFQTKYSYDTLRDLFTKVNCQS